MCPNTNHRQLEMDHACLPAMDVGAPHSPSLVRDRVLSARGERGALIGFAVPHDTQRMADHIQHATPEVDRSTELALERTRAAYERTMMAWIRTATSLITFGFTVYKFF